MSKRPGNPTTKLELIWYYVANSVLGVSVLALLWFVLTLPGS